MSNQIQAIEQKLKQGKVKNRYAAVNKIKKLKRAKNWFEFLAR